MKAKTPRPVRTSGASAENRAYFRLRVPGDMLERVRAEAKKNYRSMTAEMASILTEHFNSLDAHQKKRGT
jgi:hypothetical protein